MFDPEIVTFEQAHRRYQRLRRLAYEEAARTAGKAHLRPAILTEIDSTALEAWGSGWATRRHWTGEGGFPWHIVSRRYCRKPRCFHLAIWGSGILCGLAVGWVSDAHERLTLHFMESSPDPRHPLRGDITFLAFTAAEWYARAVGARTMVLRNPLPGVIGRYAKFGFALARERRGKLYFHKQLT
jgi:hypothetical protein